MHPVISSLPEHLDASNLDGSYRAAVLALLSSCGDELQASNFSLDEFSVRINGDTAYSRKHVLHASLFPSELLRSRVTGAFLRYTYGFQSVQLSPELSVVVTFGYDRTQTGVSLTNHTRSVPATIDRIRDVRFEPVFDHATQQSLEDVSLGLLELTLSAASLEAPADYRHIRLR